MATVFYDHLVPWSRVELALEELGLPRDEHYQVIQLFEEVVHTEVLMIILTHLPNERHSEFLERFHQAPFETEHIVYLQTHATPEIHIHIEQRSYEVIEDLIQSEKPTLLGKIKQLFTK